MVNAIKTVTFKDMLPSNTILLMDESGVLVLSKNTGEAKVLGVIKPNDYLAAIKEEFDSSRSIATDILPDNCVFFRRSDDINTFVIQMKPSMYNLNFDDCDYDDDEDDYIRVSRIYRIALPYIGFVISVNKDKLLSTSCFASKTRLTNLKAKVLQPPLPNVYTNTLRICLGSSVTRDGFTKTNMVIAINRFVNQFMATSFNDDIMPDFRSNFEEYETRSKEDPMYGLKMYLKPSHHSINSLLES